jgi:predicted O-methyltransferase YrrM
VHLAIAGFDAVFIDADKELPTYFDWGMRLLRNGDCLCDNAFPCAAVDPKDNPVPHAVCASSMS